MIILNHFSTNTQFMNDRTLCSRVEWGLRYRVLIDRYTNIIRGVFSGHTHEDSFQVMRGVRDAEVTAVIHVNPALTTYRAANPSFRVYEMDPETFVLIDYVQYRLYINKADEEGVAKWEKAYRFSEYYKVPSLDYDNFPVIVDRISSDRAELKRFTNMMYSEGPRGDVLYDAWASQEFITCRLNSSDIYEYQECIGFNYVSLETFFGYGVLAKFFNLPWSYIIEG